MKYDSILFPPPSLPVTSDVQSANITFFNTTVSLYCVFADSGSASGCRFILSLTDGTQEEIDILRSTAGGTVSMDCAQTSHARFTISTTLENQYYMELFSVHTNTHTHTHTLHTTHTNNTRDDYIVILVFDLEDDNTTGTLAIHPYVEETDKILCEQPPQQPLSANKPHKSSARLSFISKSLINNKTPIFLMDIKNCCLQFCWLFRWLVYL